MTELDVLAAAGNLADALEAGGFAYALGGAVALAYWAPPRATVDVDIGVDAAPLAVPDLVELLRRAGCVIDRERALQAAARGDFGARLGGVRIDVFLPVFPLAESALQRRVSVPLGERQVWIQTAEDVALLKLVFGRTKDFADLERLVATQGERLDWAYIDSWLPALFEPGDPRADRFAELRRRGA